MASSDTYFQEGLMRGAFLTAILGRGFRIDVGVEFWVSINFDLMRSDTVPLFFWSKRARSHSYPIFSILSVSSRFGRVTLPRCLACTSRVSPRGMPDSGAAVVPVGILSVSGIRAFNPRLREHATLLSSPSISPTALARAKNLLAGNDFTRSPTNLFWSFISGYSNKCAASKTSALSSHPVKHASLSYTMDPLTTRLFCNLRLSYHMSFSAPPWNRNYFCVGDLNIKPSIIYQFYLIFDSVEGLAHVSLGDINLKTSIPSTFTLTNLLNGWVGKVIYSTLCNLIKYYWSILITQKPIVSSVVIDSAHLL
jgi:hypothetical protein